MILGTQRVVYVSTLLVRTAVGTCMSRAASACGLSSRANDRPNVDKLASMLLRVDLQSPARLPLLIVRACLKRIVILVTYCAVSSLCSGHGLTRVANCVVDGSESLRS